jgi:hypothetical protein
MKAPPKKIPTNVTVSEDVRAELERMAEDERMSLSMLIDRALTEWLRSKGQLKPKGKA